jgi:hypothetical protein
MTPFNRLAVAVALSVTAADLPSARAAEAGSIFCVNDKWDEKEIAKDHKVVDYAGRCVKMPDDTAAPKVVEECSGKYEYKADKTWTGRGGCTSTFPDGDKVFVTWEESNASKEWPYKVTGGTGKYANAAGSGTYHYDNLTDTLAAGRYNGDWK